MFIIKIALLTHTFEVGTNPRNDMFWDYASGSNDRLYGQSARTAFYNRVSAESAFSSSIYGDSAPVNRRCFR